MGFRSVGHGLTQEPGALYYQGRGENRRGGTADSDPRSRKQRTKRAQCSPFPPQSRVQAALSLGERKPKTWSSNLLPSSPKMLEENSDVGSQGGRAAF